MENRKLQIIGIGEMLWDIQGQQKTFGGAPANFACHCCSFGATTSIISCVGNDFLGKEGLNFLKHHGVNTDLVSINAETETGVVNVILDTNGVPSYEIKENVAWDFIPFSDKIATELQSVDAVCFGSLSQRNSVSRKSIDKYLQACSESCLKVFDINIRQNYYSDEIILSSLKHANVLKLNDDELPLVAKVLNIEGSQKELLQEILNIFNLKLAILTCGSEGALMITENEESFEVPPVPIEIKSTVGAGDSFTAAAIIGFLQNKSLTEINKHANDVASFVCSQTGAVPMLPPKLTIF